MILLDDPHRDALPGEYICSHFREGADYKVLRRNGTRDWLLFATAGGCGRLRGEDGSCWLARPGTVAIYEPGAWQDYRTHEDTWDFLWVHFVPEASWAIFLKWPLVWPGLRAQQLSAPLRGAVCASLEEVVAWSRSQRAFRNEMCRNQLEHALLLAASASTSQQMDDRISSSLAWLAERIDWPFNLAEAARHVGLSVSRYAHLFREQVGTTPREAHEACRLDHAGRLLLNSSYHVAEIADMTGFEDPFYFSTRFRRRFGKPPTQFRRAAHARLEGESG